MTYYMGIDGGGSNLRIVVVNAELHVVGQAQSTTVNPNIVGFYSAQIIIQETMRAVLSQLNLAGDTITGVGIGVAGAPTNVADAWLRETIADVCPHAQIVTSSDHEIALVAAADHDYVE